jgi:hypothetical protein
MELSGQLQASTVLTAWKVSHGTQLVAGLVVSIDSLDAIEKRKILPFWGIKPRACSAVAVCNE